jgi:hypothetical protein
VSQAFISNVCENRPSPQASLPGVPGGGPGVYLNGVSALKTAIAASTANGSASGKSSLSGSGRLRRGGGPLRRGIGRAVG